MKRIFLSLCIVAFLAAPVFGADPPAFHFPDVAGTPIPTPAPAPPTKLAKGQIFVVPHVSDFLLVASRDGLVKISRLKLPATLFGDFVDPKPGDDEGRTYTTGCVYVVKASGVGQVELIASLDLTGKSLTRLILDVDGGTPAPVPPGPGPQPNPNPNPPTPTPDATLLKSLSDAFAKDVDADKAASVSKLAAVFRVAAKVTATDTAFKTVKDIDEAVRFASQGSIGVLAIPATRDACGVWLRSQLPTKADTVLDDALRQKYVAAWTALSVALDKVK